MTMKARYLVRFDDICATMDWRIWEQVEALLLAEGVSPILAIIPNNGDPKMMVSPPRPDFWERVRGWQARGWTIGLHGDDHRYVTSEAGIVGLNQRSEFAGLRFEEQDAKIARGLATFAAEGVRADLFVAPAHSFDWTTVEVLKRHGVTTVSDGFYVRTMRRGGVTFIPQQLWGFRRMPFGVWTICHHHNDFTPQRLATLAHDLRAFRESIVAVDDVAPEAKPFGPIDQLSPYLWYAAKSAAQARKALRATGRSPALSTTQ
jgi:predicted deacetylase